MSYLASTGGSCEEAIETSIVKFCLSKGISEISSNDEIDAFLSTHKHWSKSEDRRKKLCDFLRRKRLSIENRLCNRKPVNKTDLLNAFVRIKRLSSSKTKIMQIRWRYDQDSEFRSRVHQIVHGDNESVTMQNEPSLSNAKTVTKCISEHMLCEKTIRTDLELPDSKAPNSTICTDQNYPTDKSTQETDTSKSQELYCVCRKEYRDGDFMVQCQTCEKWYHPECIFPKASLEITFGKMQWDRCNLTCYGSTAFQGHKNHTFRHGLSSTAKPPDENTANPADLNHQTADASDETLSQHKLNTSHNFFSKLVESQQEGGRESSERTLPMRFDCSEEQSCNEAVYNCPEPGSNKEIQARTRSEPETKQYNTIQPSPEFKTKPDPKTSLTRSQPENPGSTYNSANQNESTSAPMCSTIEEGSNTCSNFAWFTTETVMKLGKFDKDVFHPNKEDVCITHSWTIEIEEWEHMIKDRSKNRFSKNSYYYLPLFRSIVAVYDKCVPVVKNQYLTKERCHSKLQTKFEYYQGTVRFRCGHRNCCDCNIKGKIELFRNTDKIKCKALIEGIRKHKYGCCRARPVRGEERRKIQKELKCKSAIKLHREMRNELSDDQRIYGAHTYAPSTAVLRTIKSKAGTPANWDTDAHVNLKTLAQKFKDDESDFIRAWQGYPPGAVLFSNSQKMMYKQICQKDVTYFDATGGIIQSSSNHPAYQIYTLLVRNPYEGCPGLPVATFITTCHNATNIKYFLGMFKDSDPGKIKPRLCLIDGALALWNAILATFCNETRLEYYHRCYRIVTGEAKKTVPLVLNCLSHSMRAASVMCKKYYSREYSLSRDVMHWISLLFLADTITELDVIVRHLCNILLLKQKSAMVERSYISLQYHPRNLCEKLKEEFAEYDRPTEECENKDDFFSDVIAWDKKQEQQSPFYLRYKRIMQDFKNSNTYAECNDDTRYPCANVYFSDNFAQKLQSTIFPRLCATSAIILGDLSRHAKDTDPSSSYENFRKDYAEIKEESEKKNLQSICSVNRNRTQGIIEQHFHQLKNVYMNNSKPREIDKFILNYAEELDISCKLYTDSLVHAGYMKESALPPPKESKTLPLIKSEFKSRKRRKAGRYTSKEAAKTMKYVSNLNDTLQSRNLIKDRIEQFKSSKYETSPNSEAIAMSKSFSHSLWYDHNFALDYCNEPAFVTKYNQKVTWLDVHSVCPHPKRRTLEILQSAVSNKTSSGWLTTDVVNTYVSMCTSEANSKTEYPLFGFASTYDVELILKRGRNKKMSDIFQKFFNTQGQIKENVLMPILRNDHFMIIWFNRQENTWYLIDSIEDKKLAFVRHLKSKLQNFFRSCDSPVSKPFPVKVRSMCVVKQNNNSGCGVCVCLVAKVICADNMAGYPLDQENFRSWILYELSTTSKNSDTSLSTGQKDLLPKSIGLKNFGNTCWYNSVMQATVACLSRSSIDNMPTNANTERRNNYLVIRCLLMRNEIHSEELRAAVTESCINCSFEYGIQQDACEFFELSDLPDILQSSGLSPYSVVQIKGLCHSCDFESVFQETLKTILLPISDNSVTSIATMLDIYCKSNFDGSCGRCQRLIELTRNIIGKPDVMVIGLSRNDHGNLVSVRVQAENTVFVDHVQYSLCAVVTRHGSAVQVGHYVTYVIKDSEATFLFNDEAVSSTDAKCAVEIIANHGYLFFYKRTSNQLAESSTANSDSDNFAGKSKCSVKILDHIKENTHQIPPPKDQKLLPMSVKQSQNGYTSLGKRRQPLKNISIKLCESWRCRKIIATLDDPLHKSLADEVVIFVKKICHTALNDCLNQPHLLRHALFLQSRLNTLKEESCSIKVSKNIQELDSFENFAISLAKYVRAKLCLEKVKTRRLVGHDITLPVKLLSYHVFSPSAINKECDLMRLLSPAYKSDVYYNKVLIREILIKWMMLTKHLDYDQAVYSLNFGFEKTITDFV